MTKTAHANPADPALAAFVDVSLVAHAHGGPGAVRSIAVSGTLQRSGSLQLEYRMSAALERVRLTPSTCHAQRRDELWRHTCFELFAAPEGDTAYCEFNFSPAGDWAAYRFASYRATRADAPQRRLDVQSRASGAEGLLRVRAVLDLGEALGIDAAALAATGWQLNCAAIVEELDGRLSYWAAHHPSARPDFHDRGGFRIALAASARAAATEARS